MTDLTLPIDGFITILDYLGTVAFAVTGASKAIAHKADIFGIIVLASVVGVAGGITRDMILGKFPMAFSDPTYIGLTTAVGVTTFFFYIKFKKHASTWLIFDAIGLGVFSIIGASVMYHTVGLNLLPMVLAGMITAIGGGILRDVFVREIPIVFVREIYAVASIIGILLFCALLYLDLDIRAASLLGIFCTTGIRLLAIKYDWHLPKVKRPH